MARKTGRSTIVNRILAITPPRGKIAEVRARLLTRIVNRTLKSNPSFTDRLAQQLIVRVSGRPEHDPELDHDAYLDK
ncbi:MULTISPECIES: hypothetical protein [Mycobacterium]|uniref:Uncharacterized protein n=1 Tax=Mycobacterium persicum TaxID=1487726 RepID=A0AB38UYC6_9MYCO|nr:MULTISPECIES: hypothetical protein [Mycobacterium]KZS86246.1 hypothetical protein A4G31_09620 [Mycobacterium persicum]VAZ62686.1 hypothetical protein LAUMK22_04510 [Mycobacterium kansasii]VAZ79661.1 hypothetical protein LAUMK15_05001 [Mycobacterium persicum]VAZ85838.1 hypothetical protein LAUMK42_04676 [Mycobacterium persicum]VAZ99696.1 hypothetical protein LAUMK4_04693 [Mycobacterium persicum]